MPPGEPSVLGHTGPLQRGHLGSGGHRPKVCALEGGGGGVGGGGGPS